MIVFVMFQFVIQSYSTGFRLIRTQVTGDRRGKSNGLDNDHITIIRDIISRTLQL